MEPIGHYLTTISFISFESLCLFHVTKLTVNNDQHTEEEEASVWYLLSAYPLATPEALQPLAVCNRQLNCRQMIADGSQVWSRATSNLCFPVLVWSKANWLLVVESYLAEKYKSGINLFVSLSGRMGMFPKMLNFSIKDRHSGCRGRLKSVHPVCLKPVTHTLTTAASTWLHRSQIHL